jgi:hypothetical protein
MLQPMDFVEERTPYPTVTDFLRSFNERFAFVMSILEGNPMKECAFLLQCSRRDVMIACVLALKRQSTVDALAEEMCCPDGL